MFQKYVVKNILYIFIAVYIINYDHTLSFGPILSINKLWFSLKNSWFASY